jgi:hypothetical protein
MGRRISTIFFVHYTVGSSKGRGYDWNRNWTSVLHRASVQMAMSNTEI